MKRATKLKLMLISGYTVIVYAVPVLLSMVVDGSADYKRFIFSSVTYGVGLAVGTFWIGPGCDRGADE